MTKRHEYSLDLSNIDHYDPPLTAARLQLRTAQPTDAYALAELMIKAYRGTIDYDGETLEDAIGEVQAYLTGKKGGRPLLNESRLAFAGPLLVGACLAGDWHERQLPLIAYVMTHAEWKNRGVGRHMLCAVLQALREQNYREVRAVITEGNAPSERLFGRMGFQKVSNTVAAPPTDGYIDS
jgi:RimJ/RimL family protein N-acetyltransferase